MRASQEEVTSGAACQTSAGAGDERENARAIWPRQRAPVSNLAGRARLIGPIRYAAPGAQ